MVKIYQSSLITCLLSVACAAATSAVNADTVAPAVPTPLQAVAPAPVPDPSALQLLADNETKLLSLQSLQATDTAENFFPATATNPKSEDMHMSSSIFLEKPNLFRQETTNLVQDKAGAWTKSHTTLIYDVDGKKSWLWTSYNNEYRTQDADATGKTDEVDLQPLRGFFDTNRSIESAVKSSVKDGSLISLTTLQPATWNGKKYNVVEFVSSPLFFAQQPALVQQAPGGKVIETEDIYIGEDSLIGRIVTQYNLGWKIEDQVSYSSTNKKIANKQFAFNVPTGAHLPIPPPALLAKGVPAPDFAVVDSNGKTVHLSDYAGKVVVLDFWATWCGPCQASLPHTNSVAKTFADKVTTQAGTV